VPFAWNCPGPVALWLEQPVPEPVLVHPEKERKTHYMSSRDLQLIGCLGLRRVSNACSPNKSGTSCANLAKATMLHHSA